MNKIKTLVVVLAIGLAGVAYANNPNNSFPNPCRKEMPDPGASYSIQW